MHTYTYMYIASATLQRPNIQRVHEVKELSPSLDLEPARGRFDSDEEEPCLVSLLTGRREAGR